MLTAQGFNDSVCRVSGPIGWHFVFKLANFQDGVRRLENSQCKSIQRGRKTEGEAWKSIWINIYCWLDAGVNNERGTTNPLEKPNLIKHSQHVFMNGKSSLTNLLQFFVDVMGRVDRRVSVDVFKFSKCIWQCST